MLQMSKVRHNSNERKVIPEKLGRKMGTSQLIKRKTFMMRSK